MRLTINRQWVDSDGMLEVLLMLEGRGFSANQNFYVYPADLINFANRLKAFPSNLNDEPTLEIGSRDENSYCWVRLRIFAFDHRGHSALEFSMKRNGDPQISAESRFSVILEPASVNALGQEMENWANHPEHELLFTRPDA